MHFVNNLTIKIHIFTASIDHSVLSFSRIHLRKSVVKMTWWNVVKVAAKGVWKSCSKFAYGAYVGYEGHEMVQSFKQTQAVETPHRGMDKFHPQELKEHEEPIGANDIVVILLLSILFLLLAILLVVGGKKCIVFIGNRAIRRHEDNN